MSSIGGLGCFLKQPALPCKESQKKKIKKKKKIIKNYKKSQMNQK
jgi:hypothetical protein